MRVEDHFLYNQNMGFFGAYDDGRAKQWEHPLLFFFICIPEM
jgi:hypothetical protein